MSVYRRGQIWWFKFSFQGQIIRQSTKTGSKTVAKEAERVRRRELEEAINRIPKRKRMPLFSLAAEQWLATKNPQSPYTALHYRQYVNSLSEIFGRRLVCDIAAEDIADLQRLRENEGKSGRTSNAEIGVLRQILKRYRLWNELAETGAVKFRRERRDIGRSISLEDEQRLIGALRQSPSPALLPLFIVSIDSGLRASEVRHLRRRDLHLAWNAGVIQTGEIVVSRSKTENGTGRVVPLTHRSCAVLSLWMSRFREASPDTFVFPKHQVGFAGVKLKPYVYAVRLDEAIGEWKSAWNAVRQSAGVDYRWHDLRHTFITRLAENSNISEQTITALAGHVSKRMLERYSHIRARAKRDAIATLERNLFGGIRAQNWAQLLDPIRENDFTPTEKHLN